MSSLREVAHQYTAHRRAQRAFEHILSEVMREDLEGVRYDTAARLEDRERTAVVPQYVWKVRFAPLSEETCLPPAPLIEGLDCTRVPLPSPVALLIARLSSSQRARSTSLIPDVLKSGQQSGLTYQ